MKRVLNRMGIGIEKFSELAGLISSYAVMLLIIFLTFGVVLRYFFQRPLAFGEEVTGYLLTFIVFMGIGYTMKTGGHVLTDVLVKYFSDQVKEGLKIPRNILGVIFAVIFTTSAWILFIKNYVREAIEFGSLRIPTWIPNIIFVVGSTAFLFEMIVILIKSLRKE